MKNNIVPIISTVFLILGSAALLVLGAVFGAAKYKQSKCTAMTDAVITSVETTQKRQSVKGRSGASYYITVYYPAYSFTAGGAEYSGADEFAAEKDESFYRTGGTVTVHYQPDDSGNNYIAPVSTDRYPRLLWAVRIFLPLGILGIISRFRNKT